METEHLPSAELQDSLAEKLMEKETKEYRGWHGRVRKKIRQKWIRWNQANKKVEVSKSAEIEPEVINKSAAWLNSWGGWMKWMR